MSKRQEMREKRRRQQRNQQVVLISVVVIGVLLVAFALIYTSLQPGNKIIKVADNPRPQANFNAMGNPKAPVKIIEYADFQCPYCKQFTENTEQQVVDTYVKTGKVYFEYHSFGAFIGAESARAAQAAYCAGDQGKFWEYHDMLFANQGPENSGSLTDARLQAFAQTIGLDANTFNTCLSSGKYTDRVNQDGIDAQKAGVQATPSFVINGTLVQGAISFTDFQAKVDSALQAAGASN